jgi:hypothetical protein
MPQGTLFITILTPRAKAVRANLTAREFICCQPEALSPLKVAVASNVPVLFQRFPTCVPVIRKDRQDSTTGHVDWRQTGHRVALPKKFCAQDK